MSGATTTTLSPEELRQRVIDNTSRDNGRLNNPQYEIDARAVAILTTRRQIGKDFGYTSILGFSTTVLISWEALAVTFQGGLVNGGPSALTYGLILSFIGSLATAFSLAEIASMSPTSGGQYHWIALLAPQRYAIVFSWFAGWITTFTRIAVTASICFLGGTMIQGLVILNYADYVPQQWHGTMLYWAVLLLIVMINILAIRAFPYIETVALIFHVIFFFTLLIPLVYLSPQSSPDFVFKSFENNSGWSNDAVSWLIGLLTSTYAFSGVDSVTHMSEEVQNSAVLVPRAMIWSMVLSGALCFGFSVAVLFSIGDITQALQSPTGFPIIEIFYNTTQSYRATNAMTAALIMSMIFSALGLVASASRFAWAFARDDGLPFSKFFSHVDNKYGIPIRAMLGVAFIVTLLGLINIGSTTAFNALISLTLLGQYTTYCLPTGLILYRRIRRDKHLPFGPWQLGKWGIPLNIVTIIFSVVTLAFNLLPPYYPVTASNLNYAPVVFGAALLLTVVFWISRGKYHYRGPIRRVIESGDVRSALLERRIEDLEVIQEEKAKGEV